METLSKRVDLAMREKGCGVTELALASGVRPPSVSDWLNGKTLSLKAKTAHRASRFLGVAFLWLTEGIGPMHDGVPKETGPGDDRLPVRRALFKLSAGVSGYEIEYENGESEPIFMARRWFEQRGFKPEKLLALKVSGRSMEPKMHEDDLVIINTESTKPIDGLTFAVNYEGEMVIKRMKRDAGQWFISSDNPDKVRYGDKVCAEGCFIIGEVVYLQTENI